MRVLEKELISLVVVPKLKRELQIFLQEIEETYLDRKVEKRETYPVWIDKEKSILYDGVVIVSSDFLTQLYGAERLANIANNHFRLLNRTNRFNHVDIFNLVWSSKDQLNLIMSTSTRVRILSLIYSTIYQNICNLVEHFMEHYEIYPSSEMLDHNYDSGLVLVYAYIPYYLLDGSEHLFLSPQAQLHFARVSLECAINRHKK